MKKTALLLLCTLVHTVLWSQIGIYKIDGDLEVTGDAQTDGNVNVGAAAPIGITTIHHPGTIGGGWGDGVTGFSEAALVLNNIKPDLSSNDMMALDSNQIISNSQLNIGSTDGLRFYAGGVSRFVVTDTGNFGIGTETPEQKMHITDGVAPTLMLEATTQQVYNGPVIWLKTNSSDPDIGITAIANVLVDAADYGKSQFVIQKRAMDGTYKANIMTYRHDSDRWAMSPGGTEVLVLNPLGVHSKLLFTAHEGIDVSNGLTSDSITLGGVTHTEWPISPAPVVDPVTANFDVTNGTNWQGASSNSTSFGYSSAIISSNFGFLWGSNVLETSEYGTTWGLDNNVRHSDNGTVWGIENFVNNSAIGTAWGQENNMLNAKHGTVWGEGNSIEEADFSTVWGDSNFTTADLASSWGRNNRSYSYLSTVFGRYATYASSHDGENWIVTEPLLLVGNGSDSLNRSNALELLKNGNFKVSGTIQASKGVVLDNGAEATAGAIRWTGTDFEGHDGTEWKPLSAPAETVNGDISMGTFTN